MTKCGHCGEPYDPKPRRGRWAGEQRYCSLDCYRRSRAFADVGNEAHEIELATDVHVGLAALLGVG